jgi:Cu(I)/Ag(I) efflux system periplasmic protein CusF
MSKLFFGSIILAVSLTACATAPKNTNVRPPALAPTPIKTPIVPNNGDYQGRGKVTRIELKGGSVELDHEEIPDAMPAMKMEFFVSDKAMLNGLKLGDEVDFTLRYNNGQETIVAISKIR